MTLYQSSSAPVVDALVKRSSVVGILELACRGLDLTPTQYERARASYRAVGEHLSATADIRLSTALVYPQGSIAHETANKPVGRNEFDVDAVSRMPLMNPETPPAVAKALVGKRLRENTYYASILEEKPRCWRLNYKGEFHLDLTPSILNPGCAQGGELVPDRDLRCWKETNPKGMLALFDRRAALVPRLLLSKVEMSAAKAMIEDLPQPARFKGLLRRIVQMLKRNRDLAFIATPDIAPISVIITVLAARSYELCVMTREYDTELDVLLDVVAFMPKFIEHTADGYAIWNETTQGENFAEKWNKDARLPLAFSRWHGEVLRGLQQIASAVGIDGVTRSIGAVFGDGPSEYVRKELTSTVSRARTGGVLGISTSSGLVVGASKQIPVSKNTFYGVRD